MITIENYHNQTCKIDFSKLPEPLKKGNDLAKKALANQMSAYKGNETISRVVDSYIAKLNQYLESNSPVVETKTEKKTETSSPKQVNQASSPIEVAIRKASEHSKMWAVWDVKRNALFANEKFSTHAEAVAFVHQNGLKLQTEKPQSTPNSKPTTPQIKPAKDSAERVEMIPLELSFVRRYVALHGKVKSKQSVLTLLSSLQKAILERRIRKDSVYAKEIIQIQNQLITAVESMADMAEIEIDAKKLEHYKGLISTRRIRESIALLKRYLSIHGKPDVQDKAKRLKDAMERSVKRGAVTKDDPYSVRLNQAYKSLALYLNERSDAPSIAEGELNGIRNLVGGTLSEKPISHKEVLSSQDLLRMNFETIGLIGKFRDLIGDPSVGFTAMVFGQPKSGKSTLMLEFAQELAVHHGKVLYAAIEEGYGYTLKEKIQRVGATSSQLHFSEKLPSNLSSYDFVFVDSVSRAGIELEDMIKLKNRYPRTGFIFIFHSTKDGKFRGGNELAHEVDVIIEVEAGIVRASGRFNAGGKLLT